MDEPHFPLNSIIQNAPHLFLRSKILVWNAYPGLKCKCKAASSQQVQRSSQLGVELTRIILLVSFIACAYGHRTQIRTRISLCFICCGRISHECVANLKRLGIARGEWNWTEFMLRERENRCWNFCWETVVFFHRDCFWAVELETNTSARSYFSVAPLEGGKEGEVVSNNFFQRATEFSVHCKEVWVEF